MDYLVKSRFPIELIDNTPQYTIDAGGPILIHEALLVDSQEHRGRELFTQV